MTHNFAPHPTIDVRGLHVAYRRRGVSVDAVRGVDLRVQPGEILAIVGESGSGKSTLAAALLGLHDPTVRVRADKLRILDRDMCLAREPQWRELRRGGIALVPQDPLVSLNPSMRIGQQVREALGPAHSDLTWDDRVIAALRDAGLDAPEQRMRQYPHELSGGQRQRALIAIALACQPRVIIADEPTSALDVTVQRRILDHLETLVRERGISLILITHDLAVAAERSHRILVLDAGTIAAHGATREVMAGSESPVVRTLLDAAPQLTASGELALGRLTNGVPDTAAGRDLVTLREVSKLYRGSGRAADSGAVRALDRVNLTVAQGQTLGIVGESGSGKSTLLRTALALVKPSAGHIEYAGQNLQQLRPRELRAMRRRFQLVQQDPFASFDPRYTVARCIEEPLRAFRIGSRAERRARVEELLELVDLPRDFASRLPRQLSGGQRQRVSVARALAAEPETIYLDEPVSALDATVQQRLLDTLVEIQKRLQITYVFVSHDLAVIARIAHRVAVMRDGQIVEEGSATDVLHFPRTDYTRTLIDAIPRAPRD